MAEQRSVERMVNKKYIYVFYVLALFGIEGCATVPSIPEAPKVIEGTVRSKVEGFRRNIKIEISKYDDARIENVYLEHGRKKEKTDEKDYLYVHGAVVNQSISFLSGTTVRAEFFDDMGNRISDGFDDATPRILRHRGSGRSKAYFTIRTLYNPKIVYCKLSIGRGHQVSYFKELE